MYEVVFFITVVLLLAIIILFIYVALSQDIFDVLQPRIDDKLKDDKYLNTTNFSEEKKVEEEINKNIDSKIGTLPSESSNVVDYINTRITDSNTRTTAETDTKISNIVGDLGDSTNITSYIENQNNNLETIINTKIGDIGNKDMKSYMLSEYDFITKQNEGETTYEYTIGDPTVNPNQIKLVNDKISIDTALDICNSDRTKCYTLKVDEASDQLLIGDSATIDSTDNAELHYKFKINNTGKIYANGYHPVLSTSSDGITRYSYGNDLQDILTNKLNNHYHKAIMNDNTVIRPKSDNGGTIEYTTLIQPQPSTSETLITVNSGIEPTFV